MKIVALLFLLIIFEFIYSVYKKDGIYSRQSTKVNLINETFGIMKDFLIPNLSVIVIITYINAKLPHLFDIPNTVVFFVLGVVILDLLYYFFHRLCHKWSALWMFHFVHHGDTRLNLSVAFRSSWFEMIGLFVFYSFALIIGFPLSLFLSIFIFTSTYQFLTHSRYIKLPKFFEWIFVTPKYHSVHHNVDIEKQNRNFGGVFSIWDRLFGTYTKNVESELFGIEGYSQNNFIKIHTDPIFDFLKIHLKGLTK